MPWRHSNTCLCLIGVLALAVLVDPTAWAQADPQPTWIPSDDAEGEDQGGEEGRSLPELDGEASPPPEPERKDDGFGIDVLKKQEEERAARHQRDLLFNEEEVRKRLRDTRPTAPRTDTPAAANAATSEPPPLLHFPVELALLPVVSSNALVGERVANNFCLHLLGGHSAQVVGFALGLPVSWVQGELTGLQLGALSAAEGGLIGLQLGALANYASGHSAALQLTLGVNVAGALDVAQVAPLVNLAFGEVNGLQLASLLNRASGKVVGGQLAALNLAWDLRGAQLSALGNVAREATGLQLGLFNASSSLRGIAIGAFNTAGDLGKMRTGDLTGLMLGPGINLARDVTGAQVGLINVARHVTGLQLGLINLAETTQGASVGLLSFVGDGMQALELGVDEGRLPVIGLKMGSRYVYTVGQVALQPLGATLLWAPGLGVGAHLPVASQFFVDADVTTSLISAGAWSWELPSTVNRLRASGGWRLHPNVAVLFGASLNALLSSQRDGRTLHLWEQWPGADLGATRLWPGVHLGLQLMSDGQAPKTGVRSRSYF